MTFGFHPNRRWIRPDVESTSGSPPARSISFRRCTRRKRDPFGSAIRRDAGPCCAAGVPGRSMQAAATWPGSPRRPEVGAGPSGEPDVVARLPLAHGRTRSRSPGHPLVTTTVALARAGTWQRRSRLNAVRPVSGRGWSRDQHMGQVRSGSHPCVAGARTMVQGISPGLTARPVRMPDGGPQRQ